MASWLSAAAALLGILRPVARWFVDPRWDLSILGVAVLLVLTAVSTCLAAALRGSRPRALLTALLVTVAAAWCVIGPPMLTRLDRIGARLYVDVYEEPLEVLISSPLGSRNWPRALTQHDEPAGFSMVFGGFLDNTWGLAYLDPSHPIPQIGGGFAGVQLTALERIKGNWYLFYTT